jgi:hypothetical protein
VKGLYERNDVTITKVTHAGRGYTAKTARENGASATEVKALGVWSDSGSYRACYDRALPVRALLAAAMFDSEHPETHFLARDSLGMYLFFDIPAVKFLSVFLQSLLLKFWPQSSHGSKTS